MKKEVITAVCLLMLSAAMVTGCSNKGKGNDTAASSDISAVHIEEKEPSADDKSEPANSKNNESSVSGTTSEYDEITTFEYTEEMLGNMNKDYPEFEIIHDKQGTIIDGHINTAPVKNERDAIEQIKLIRSVLSLVNPEQQLVFDKNKSTEKKYMFDQYYGGYRINSMYVTVETDDEDLIVYTTSSVIPPDTLKNIRLDGLLSKEEILAKQTDYKNANITQTEIWANNKYAETPVVVYIGHDDDNTILFSAENGSIIDIWSDIID